MALIGSIGFIQFISTGRLGNSLNRSRTRALWNLQKIGVWDKMQFSSTITLTRDKMHFDIFKADYCLIQPLTHNGHNTSFANYTNLRRYWITLNLIVSQGSPVHILKQSRLLLQQKVTLWKLTVETPLLRRKSTEIIECREMVQTWSLQPILFTSAQDCIICRLQKEKCGYQLSHKTL